MLTPYQAIDCWLADICAFVAFIDSVGQTHTAALTYAGTTADYTTLFAAKNRDIVQTEQDTVAEMAKANANEQATESQ